MWGFYLLFSPVIAVLKWIPLVGWLLGGVVSFAAAIFGVIVGGVISLLIIALAWVVYRPLIGLTLLAGVGVGVYFIFFFKKGEVEIIDDTMLEEAAAAAGSDPSSMNPTAPVMM